MDPKHIIKALAVMYVEEHGGRLFASKSVLIEAYRKASNLSIQVIEGAENTMISVILEEK